MSIQKLIDHIDIKFFDLSKYSAADLYQGILDYKTEQDEQYKKLKTENKVTFGKYRGFSIRELTSTLKGKEYCRWLLKQDWFTEKFTDLIEEMEKYGIKKN
jgi:uncharacterized protein (DUF3820 family)